MFKRLFTASLVFGAAAIAPPLAAQAMHCAPRDVLIERLEETYGERQIAIGMQSAHALIELWGSEETGSFTLIVTTSDAESCVMAFGADLLVASPMPEEETTGF